MGPGGFRESRSSLNDSKNDDVSRGGDYLGMLYDQEIKDGGQRDEMAYRCLQDAIMDAARALLLLELKDVWSTDLIEVIQNAAMYTDRRVPVARAAEMLTQIAGWLEDEAEVWEIYRTAAKS
jgi:hypothetical protein